MDMRQYLVQVWKTENRIADNGADYEEPSKAYTPEEAAKQILEVKHISGMFYVEVRLKGNDIDCWKFTDKSPELNS
jgi:hypothetical protein